MKKLYKHRHNLQYYFIDRGASGDVLSSAGNPMLVLSQPERVRSNATGLLVEHSPEMGQLVVTKLEFNAQFVLVEDCTWERNRPIAEVMANYTAERCDFEDTEYLARCALRFDAGMEDSHLRCILFAMAKKLAPQLFSELPHPAPSA